MREHEFTDANGVAWTFTQRAQVRGSEALTHVALLITSPWETRIVSCPRTEWESESPDYARLLEQSLPTGGSRGVDRPGSESDGPEF
jgi:hypothetical protein